MKITFVLSALLILVSTFSCSQDTKVQVSDVPVYAFTNVNVIPMDRETVLENQTVVIINGSIFDIGDSGKVQVPKGSTLIEGSGKYLMPGISEMHAHIPGNQNGEEIVEETLFLYLSNGITTIRGMLGQPYHLELRQRVLDNQVLGPRIYTSSPSLNGNSVKSVEEARSKVTAYQEAGYGFLKLHPGLKLDVFNEIVKTANEVGITYSGHVSIDVGIRRAIEAGYASIDHVDGYVEGLVPKSAGVDPDENGFFGFSFTDIADKSLISSLVRETKANEVWVVPTQSLMERWAGPVSPAELAAEPEMKYIPRSRLTSWQKSVAEFQEGDDFSVEKARRFNQLRREIILALNDAGVGLLLGSDAPQIFNVPGFSIQHELMFMVKSGLTPFEALKIGTVNPAAFFKQEGQYGVVIKGASADLILLYDNPLEDIGHMQNNAGVMVRGRWISEKEIDERLKKIETKYK